MINQKKNYNSNKKIRIKTSRPRSDLCDFSGAYIVVKGGITVTNPNNAKKIKQQHLKIMLDLSIVFQKLMVQKLIMQKIQML